MSITSLKPNSQTNVLLQQTVVPDYRLEVFEELEAQLDGHFEVLAGSLYFDPSVKSAEPAVSPVSRITNLFLLGRKLLWQRKVVPAAVRAETAVLEFNPRILSNWTILVLRRLRGRSTILWGHAWSRGGSTSRTEPLRSAMRRLATSLVVYTQSQRKEMLGRYPSARVIAAPNALHRRADIGAAQDTTSARAFLYSGRLVESKKPELLLEAFRLARDRGLDPAHHLIVAGDGPLLTCLKRRSEGLDGVRFLGRVAPAEMRDLYATALASVSPGYVGLSVIQSFSFGVPIIYADQEPHSPEIEAVEECFNAIAFSSDSSDELADALLAVATNQSQWQDRRGAIAERCAREYSIEVMLEGFIAAIVSGRTSPSTTHN